MPTTSSILSPNGSAPWRLKRWVYISLLFAWILLTYSLGDRVYALCIAAFMLALTVMRRRHFLFVVIPAMLVVLLFTQVPATLKALAQSNVAIIPEPDARISAILTPNSGRDVLPREVQHILILVQSRHLDTYRVSHKILNDFEQRLVEGLWPARLDPASPYNFLLNTDPADPSCRVIRQRENVILERCP